MDYSLPTEHVENRSSFHRFILKIVLTNLGINNDLSRFYNGGWMHTIK